MTRLVPLALVSMMMLSGCATQTADLHAEAPHVAERDAAARRASMGGARGVGDALVALADLAATVQDINAMTVEGGGPPPAEPDPAADLEAARVAHVYYGYNPPPSPPPSQISMPVTAADPPHHPLDPALALATLRAVDVSSCSDEGGAEGYGHARVTFGADGHVAGLLIDAPQGLSKGAADCLESRFGAASVSPFDGGPVTVGTSFYVK